MSRRQPADEDLLFDLPLDTTPAAPPPAPEEIEQPGLPLEERPPAEPAAAEELVSVVEEGAPPVAPTRRHAAGHPPAATLGQRLIAGLADLGVCSGVLVILLLVLLALGVRPVAADWPAALLFLLTFSFLYAVLPLAFWGRTPGMALAGLRKSSRDGRPLSFRQAILTWLGTVLTVALVGLPLLMAVGGRSLSDLIAGSMTRHQPH